MRLSYVSDDPKMATAEDEAIVQRVKDRRGGKLLNLDKTLLHAPQFADGWNAFLKAVRQQTTLEDSIRELIMCRTAVLCQSWFEWEAHEPLLRNTGVVSDEVILKLKDYYFYGEGLDEKHQAVLHFVDASTVKCVVPQMVFDKVKALFSEREVVEIAGTCAAFAGVSRFLVALDVGEMAEKYGIDQS